MDSPALPAAPRAMPMAGRQIQTPFPKKPCLLRGEKLIAGGGEGSAGGPDEIKRRDNPNKLKVYKSGHKRGITPTIKKELRRRSAVEAVIGHLKTDGRLGRNFLKGRDGDKINAILAGAGYNYRLVLRWLRLLFARILAAIFNALPPSFTTMTNPA